MDARRAGGDPAAVLSAAHGGKEGIGIDRDETDWKALEAEYLAGGISQEALAKKCGVSPKALSKRAREEGWVAMRKGRRGKQGKAGGAGDEVLSARRTRKALLSMLERAANTIPSDATEIKTTGENGAVKLMKLRDLTAAYKELVSDLPGETGGGERRVIIDV